MNDSIFLCLKDIKINQIPNFYSRFKRISKDKIYKCMIGNVLLNYFLSSCTLYIRVTSSKILGKTLITEKDVEEFERRLKIIISSVVNINMEEMKFYVCRFDYKVDIPMQDEEREQIFKLLNRHKMKYKYIRTRRIYKTSLHLANHSSSRNINIYDKGVESGIPEFAKVVRIELQIKNRGIKRLLEKEEKPRDIYYYWNRKSMEELFFNFFEGFLYTGRYYKLGQAIEIIKKSSYSKTLKKGLISFVTIVNKNGVSGAEKVFSYNTIRSYEKRLNLINLNPVTLDDDAPMEEMENILTRARKIAEKEYFK